MKKYICIILAVLTVLCISVSAASDTAETTAETTAVTETETVVETTEEITEEEPTEADDSEDAARIFMNINIYMFAGAIVLFIICTVVYFVMKAKKKKANTENND